MAIKYLGSALYKGLSTDTKPTTAANTAIFVETDTRATYHYNGTTWTAAAGGAGGGGSLPSSNSSMTVYLSGSLVKARDNTTGNVVHSATAATDCVPTIEYAINNIPGASADKWGGTVYLTRGVYTCKSQLDIDVANTGGYHGVELVGEGKGTRLNFSPSSTISGIKLRMSRPHIADMRIWGNANVSNLLYIVGPWTTPPVRHDFGIIERVDFDSNTFTGVGGGGEVLVEEDNVFQNGQTGILMDGSAPALYFWTIYGCHFRGLAVGMNLYGSEMTSTHQFGNTFLNCDVAEKVSGGQHNFTNFWIQGSTASGRLGLWFVPEGGGSGSTQNVTNIHAELHKTNTESAAILIDSAGGTPAANVRYVNIVNAYAGSSQYWYHVIDKTTHIIRSNLDFEHAYVPRVSRVRRRVGSLCPGHQLETNADGIMRGNVTKISPVGTGAAFTKVNTTSGGQPSWGLAEQLATGNVANNYLGYYCSNPTGGQFDRSAEPTLRVRFWLDGLAFLRLYIGLWNAFASPGLTSDPLFPPNRGVGLWADKVTFGDWRVMSNDGAGGASTLTPLSTATAVAASTMYEVEIKTDNTNNLFTLTLNGIPTTVTTDIPAAGTLFGWLIYLQLSLLGAGEQRMWVHDIELEVSK